MRIVLPCLCLLACGGLHSNHDGGSGGGGTSSGNGGGGGSSSTGGGTSSSGGGTSSNGGGTGSTGGGSGALTWHQANISIQTSETFANVVGISGRSGEIYAVSSESNLFRSTGGAFTEIIGTALSQGRGIYVASDGQVFPVAQHQLGHCASGCDVAANYSFTANGNNDDTRCVTGDAPDNVYAAVENVSYDAVLWHWDGSMWTTIVNNLGISSPRACAMMADHTVVVVGQSDAAFYLNGITTVEHPATVPPLTQNQADFQQWYGVGVAGSKTFVVGSANMISARSSPDMWTLTMFTSNSGALYGVGGPSETELFAAGGVLKKYNGSMWTDQPALPTVKYAKSMFVAGPNEIYIGGTDSNDAPVIDKLFR